jgi:hypothetical protein
MCRRGSGNCNCEQIKQNKQFAEKFNLLARVTSSLEPPVAVAFACKTFADDMRDFECYLEGC